MKELNGQVYLEPPVDFKESFEVATCYVRSGNELLFLRRRQNKPQGNMWGIPGGKCDGNDIELEMIREVYEETGIDLNNHQIHALGTVYIRYPEIDFVYHMFGVFLERERPQIIINQSEHVEYAWWSLKEGLAHPLILFEDACTFLVWSDPFFDGCKKPSLNAPIPKASLA